ncbi:MAG: glycerol dehydrogenase [Clostridia bacterium]|nr:glycerol dehydrogenase [Clostridia bacterium]
MVEATTRAFGSPSKYIQGPGEFNNLEVYTKSFGKIVFALIDGFLYDALNKDLRAIYDSSESDYHAEKFQGECCQPEVDRLTAKANEYSADVIVGIGGGKTIDTAKIVASSLNLPLVIVPTSASTDAPTSAMSVIYTESGEHRGTIRHKRNPDLVLVDTNIITKAPLRLFISGMGDALATYFEARANEASDSANFVGKGYRRCKAGMAIAKMCYDILLQDGLKAKLALKRGVCTEAVENVIEANTLLSGLGFENTGCAAAHGIHAGLTEIAATHKYLHGEKVAFGVICQLVMENAPPEELETIIRFCMQVGLPTTLAQLDVEATEENIRTIAHKVVAGNPLVHAEPFKITEDVVYNAIIAADELGKYYQGREAK